MNKLKDWFYNYSDIFAGGLITLAAGLIIFVSVSNIMSFSDSLGFEDIPDDDMGMRSSSNEDLVDTTSNEGITTSSDALESGIVSTTPSASTMSAVTTTSPTGTSLSSNVPAGKDVSIIIPGGSTGSKVAQILQDNGLIRDKNEFLKVLNDGNLGSKLRAGTFVIKSGSSIPEIMKVLTGK